MSPALAWLIAEVVKLTVSRVQGAGKLNTLTQAEAEAELTKMTESLSTDLPSPDDLVKGTQ